MSDLILRNDTGHVTRLVLNSPQNFNALSAEMIATLYTTLATVSAEENVRTIIIAANGKAFSAGHDLRQMQAARANRDRGRAGFAALFEGCGQVMQLISSLSQPVIAEVQGIATAAGCQLVASCDLAVAAKTAKFGVNGIDVGLFCSTPAVALSRAIPRKAAFEMLVTGDFIDAHEAQRRGLINRVVPGAQLDDEVGRLAASILAKSPAAIRMGKQMFYRQLEMGLDAAYQLASETMACNAMCEDAAEGIDAFIAKRKPEFKGR